MPDKTVRFRVTGGLPGGFALLVVGTRPLCQDLLGVTVVPRLDIVIPGLVLDGNGQIVVTFDWPAAIPGGTPVFAQVALIDPSSPTGLAATNAVGTVAQD